jgi:hypothetical protein
MIKHDLSRSSIDETTTLNDMQTMYPNSNIPVTMIDILDNQSIKIPKLSKDFESNWIQIAKYWMIV